MAWVTLATTDAYALGALVLAHSLRQAGTAHRLVVMITPGVTDTMRSVRGHGHSRSTLTGQRGCGS